MRGAKPSEGVQRQKKAQAYGQAATEQQTAVSNPQLHRPVTAATPVLHSSTEEAGEHKTLLGNLSILQLTVQAAG